MSPAATIEKIYADHLAQALSIPVFAGLSAAQLPQQNSFAVVVCDECQRVAGPYFRGSLAVLLRTHAMDQAAQTHSSHWSKLSEALDAAPADPRLRGHWRAESNKETEENYWLSRENVVVGFCHN
jgi:hypothetical protein